MSAPRRFGTPRWAVVLVALGLVLGACGDDGEAEPAANDPSPTTLPDDSGIAGSVSDDDLVVPRAYLQGEWCDSDGQSWTIEGDTARLTEGEGTAEFPLDLVFVAGPGMELVSQTDDQFVLSGDGDEVTFVRGSC